MLMMGLKNGPPTFQRCMNIGLAEHIGKRCFVYLDDLVIFNETFDGLLQDLKLVFQSLKRMGMTLAPAKSVFGVKRLRFLGHLVDEEGTRPDPKLVKSILEYPRPRSRVQVQAFLGLAGFYRRFIKDFALIAGPLHDLTKKDAPFCWNSTQEAAFLTLQAKCAEWPVLRRPDFSKPFFVKTDACKQGFGSILGQKDSNGREYVVAYASRKTKPCEKNYSASELECAAAVWALTTKWRPYVYGAPFQLITDHASLKWLMTATNLTGRLARWSLRLQEFDFEIVYRKGVEHKDVDALSRATDVGEGPPMVIDLTHDSPALEGPIDLTSDAWEEHIYTMMEADDDHSFPLPAEAESNIEQEASGWPAIQPDEEQPGLPRCISEYNLD